MERYLTNNEMVCHSFEDAQKIAEILLKNGYVVMISKEEDLYIVNYVWSERYADRNDVCFLSREEVEEEIFGDK